MSVLYEACDSLKLHWKGAGCGVAIRNERYLGAEVYALLMQLGLYLILFPSLGGMLLPALIIVPAHIIR